MLRNASVALCAIAALAVAVTLRRSAAAKARMLSKYKAAHAPEVRSAKVAEARERRPDCLPVIVESMDGSGVAALDNPKLLVAQNLTVGQFTLVIRKRAMVPPEKAVFVFVGAAAEQLSSVRRIADVHAQHKDADGFLYVKYSDEPLW
jgi:GABA(A) receptor-associated protein